MGKDKEIICIDDENEIMHKKVKKLQWIGHNPHYYGESSTREFTIGKRDMKDHFRIQYMFAKQIIIIESNVDIEFVSFYEWLEDIRRFEYLFYGMFYELECCKINDDEDITVELKQTELAYFRYTGWMHKIPVLLNDRNYKTYFLRWLKLKKKLGILNQMMLYGNNVRGMTADLRLAITAECFEPFSEVMEDKQLITISGSKSLANIMESVLTLYGKPVFSTEYKRRKSLARRIVDTRVKIFHVKLKKKNAWTKKTLKYLKGGACGFYAIKLEWLYRYIILLMLGIDREELDKAIEPQIQKFENEFPQLMYACK